MSTTMVYVGPLNTGGTCSHRLMAMNDLGLNVFPVDTFVYRRKSFPIWFLDRVSKRFGHHLDLTMTDRRIIDLTRRHYPDLLWIDKGLIVSPGVIERIRAYSPGTKIVSYSPDDMLNPHNQSSKYLKAIPLYDLHVTTKTYNCSELKDLGARDVLFVDNAYAPHVHAPPEVPPTLEQVRRNGVAFIGSFELERALLLEKISKKGIPLTIWGSWPRIWRQRLIDANAVVHSRELIESEYSNAISSFLINLNFLRKVNRDLQTTRSIEIPASGGFMLAERTDEHQRLFREGVEADYFSTEEELLAKIDYYLSHPELALNMARQARLRCNFGGYSNHARLSYVLTHMNIDINSSHLLQQQSNQRLSLPAKAVQKNTVDIRTL